MRLELDLPDLEATLRLGRTLAAAIAANPAPVLLLQGELGAGKTTLARFLVEALPGGEAAEVFPEGQPAVVHTGTDSWAYAELFDGRAGWVPRERVLPY
jgi:polynucleotide 5'-kinase involved in rRNA processing